MSSSNFFPSGLNKWDASDKPQRMDFVRDNEIIDERLTPTGAIQTFAGSVAPNGWLLCNGQEVSRTTYDKLFAVCGLTYGSGNGSTTFNVPDMRGRFTRGANGNLGSMGGSSSITLGSQNLPEIVWNTIQVTGTGSENGLNGITVGSIMQGPAYQPIPVKGRDGADLISVPFDVTNPYLSVSYIIKT